MSDSESQTSSVREMSAEVRNYATFSQSAKHSPAALERLVRELFESLASERARADRAESAVLDSSARALEEAASDLKYPDSGPYEVWASGAGNWLRNRAKNIREAAK